MPDSWPDRTVSRWALVLGLLNAAMLLVVVLRTGERYTRTDAHRDQAQMEAELRELRLRMGELSGSVDECCAATGLAC